MKKVLIITYYWPPAGGPGVQRVLKFVKYLPQFGWEPIILTVKNGEYPAIDKSLLKEIRLNLKTYFTKSFEPFNLYKNISGNKGNIPTHVLSKSKNESLIQKVAKWIRANLFVPDARVGWIPVIVREGLKIIDIEKPDLIFSSSPPHSLQVGAMKLAQRSGLKWVADFRDPWTDGFWQKDIVKAKFAAKKDKRLEEKVLKKSNSLITVSSSIASDFNKLYPDKCKVITNGFDPDDFSKAKKSRGDKFRINYTGTLSKDQKIDNFLDALSNLEEKLLEKVEINFYGNFHSSIVESIEENNLSDKILLHHNVDHEKVVELMFNSEILLLVIPNTKNNLGIVTGKLFEYLASQNFVLGIGPKNGDAAAILEETNCGKMFDYNDDLSEVLKNQIERWEKQIDNDTNTESVNKYSRTELTSKLVKIFEEVL